MAVAVIIALAQPINASMINCTGTDTSNVPCFTIIQSVAAGAFLPVTLTDREFFPVSGGLSLSPFDTNGLGSGSTVGIAGGLGHLGARAVATNSSPAGQPFTVSAVSTAEFQDFFVWNSGPAQLRFTFNLSGIANAFASGSSSLALESQLGRARSSLSHTGARTGTLTIPVGGMDSLFLDFRLFTEAVVGVPGTGVADFADTAEITRIEQLDGSGNFLRDITLTDVKGNVLGGAPAAVPEPTTFSLIGIGLIAAGRLLLRGARLDSDPGHPSTGPFTKVQ